MVEDEDEHGRLSDWDNEIHVRTFLKHRPRQFQLGYHLQYTMQ